MRIESGLVGDRELDALAAILAGCVDGGASIGFLRGFSEADARAWWLAQLADASNVVLRAIDDDGTTLGTVTLGLAGQPNGPHRAEVKKVLVSPAARRRGVGATLMRAAEDEALRRGRTLLLLDTVTGSAAQRLYERQGWTVFGSVPGFALSVDGTLEPTTYMYKQLDRRRS